jgi:hypothetical protein
VKKLGSIGVVVALLLLRAIPAHATGFLINVLGTSYTARATLSASGECDGSICSVTDGGEITGPDPVQMRAEFSGLYAYADAKFLSVTALNHGLGIHATGETRAFAESVLLFSPVVDGLALITVSLERYDQWGGGGVAIYADAVAGLPFTCDWEYQDAPQGQPQGATATCPTYLSASQEYRIELSASASVRDGSSRGSVRVSGLEAVPVPDASDTFMCLCIGLATVTLARRKLARQGQPNAHFLTTTQ